MLLSTLDSIGHVLAKQIVVDGRGRGGVRLDSSSSWRRITCALWKYGGQAREPWKWRSQTFGLARFASFSSDGNSLLIETEIQADKHTSRELTATLYDRRSWLPVREFKREGADDDNMNYWFMVSPDDKRLISNAYSQSAMPSLSPKSKTDNILWDVSSGLAGLG